MIDEFLVKHETDLNLTGWKYFKSTENNTPHQGNGYDCGIYILMFAYLMTRCNQDVIDIKLLSNVCMPFCREYICNAILKSKL